MSTLAKRVHRYSHGPSAEMATILAKGGMSGNTLEQVCSEIEDACDIFARTVLPLQSWKLSLFCIREAFNAEYYVDFMFKDISNRKCCVLQIVDTRTSFSKTRIVSKWSSDCIIPAWKAFWILKHESPHRPSKDSKFIEELILLFLESHCILPADRHVRHCNKTGIVKRKHRNVKTIL